MPTEEQVVGSLLAPEIAEMIDARQNHEVRKALGELLDPEVADLLLALEPHHRVVAFRLLPKERAANVFTYLPPEMGEKLLSELNSEQLAQLIDEMAPDDRALLIEELPGQLAAKLLTIMSPEERRRTQTILGYPPGTIGRIMTPDYITIRPEWTVQMAMDHIRRHGKDAETFETVWIVDDHGRLIDDLRLRAIILADPYAQIHTLVDGKTISLNATDHQEEAVLALERYDRPVLPVVDRDGVLVGIVTFDDIVDVAKKEATEDIQKLGGMEALDAPYMATGLRDLITKRGKWLAVLFLGEMLTASAMTHYEHAIEKAAVLSLFLPLIISSGGNSGSQATTLIIRAMALREITLRDWLKVFWRELACGLALGIFLGLLGFVRIHIWRSLGWDNGKYTEHYHLVALSIFASLIGVVLWGTLMGSMLPFLLRLARLDPAAISAPLVATLVDVTGLIIYFTTALVILHNTLL